MLTNTKRAIFFDFGDTMASTTPSYLIRVAMAMREAGYPISDRDFETAYVKTDYEIYKKYKIIGEMTPEEYVEWFFPILCRHLALEGDPYAIRAKMRKVLKGIRFIRNPLPGAIEILEFLKGEGFILGIISNNDGRTEEKCDEVGIREYFDVIVDSTRDGFIKPDARIFHFILGKLQLSPYEAVHIGDLYGSDVMGGLNAGLDVIWLNKRKIEKPDKTRVLEIHKLAEVKTVLELKKVELLEAKVKTV
ncbi:MAG TPA: HAD family hydrolase [Thermodesulfobacteriota bacterium]|nr:HAD family hydrolase [Thermodesulfobacteriota bacterium]